MVEHTFLSVNGFSLSQNWMWSHSSLCPNFIQDCVVQEVSECPNQGLSNPLHSLLMELPAWQLGNLMLFHGVSVFRWQAYPGLLSVDQALQMAVTYRQHKSLCMWTAFLLQQSHLPDVELLCRTHRSQQSKDSHYKNFTTSLVVLLSMNHTHLRNRWWSSRTIKLCNIQ